MSKSKQTVYLITEQQRDALISYLQNRPFREVASGIQFLMTAPTAVLNVEVPDGEQDATAVTPEVLPAETTESIKELAAV